MTLEEALKIANEIDCDLTSMTAEDLVRLIFERGIEE